MPDDDPTYPATPADPATSSPTEGPAVAVRPAGLRPHLEAAVLDAGGHLVDPDRARMLIWSDPTDATALRALLADAPQIEVVQLLWAGVEEFAAQGLFGDGRTWACGKGVYADPVAEHALTLGLALARDLPDRITARRWGDPSGRSLIGSRVTILGGGGITRSLLRLLQPFDCRTTVVRRSAQPLDGADRVVGPDATMTALADADLVVLALALTPETTGIADAAALAAMPDHAVLVNVARGGHVVTDDLVAALRDGVIGGAGLDVTDPEPLPDDHPLWSQPRCLITPHTANTEAMAVPLISARVRTNVRRLAAGRPLVGLVDAAAGY